MSNVLQQEPTDDEVNERPRRSKLLFPVVGLGASAGGLPAVLRFLEHLPSRSGMAFVVVFHLSPEHESIAGSVLQRATRMPVIQVTEDIAIEPDHVYVIAPGLRLMMEDGQLHVAPLDRTPGQPPVTIDVFFRTLAHVHGDRSVAIVLSGAGSDGSVGLADMKREGGVTFAQAPADAEYAAMPSAAISTRLVDFVLPAAEIPGKLVELWQNARRIVVPGAKAIGLKAEETKGARRIAETEAAVKEVMAILHASTGNDFQHYKRATVLRRLERRMQVTERPDIPAYRDYLKGHPEEVEPLLQDMLISVTSFFRDRDAFASMEREVMAAWERQPLTTSFRAWVAGCATGEEAYSLAMVINDHAPPNAFVPVQLFASDIDERALSAARHGIYPEAITTDVSLVRLRQYFQQEAGAYRVKRRLREQITFSRHNILRDPPFSRVDLISCRNLLIYLEREVQAQVLEIFHFALNPGGLLFLGSAETADWLPELFTVVDKRHRIYRANVLRRGHAEFPPRRPEIIPSLMNPEALAQAPPAMFPEPSYGRGPELQVPGNVLIDRQGSVVYITGVATRYLGNSEGTPSQSLLDLVRPELRSALAPALLYCLQTGKSTMARPVKWIQGNDARVVQMSVRPNGHPQAGTLAILFEEFEVSLAAVDDETTEAVASVQGVLEEEIRRLRDQLHGTIGDSASSAEALKASNEELQSINEELRSATEELATSKEELQSVNEELTTVNWELKSNIEEAAKANDDLTNLIVSMDIATIFVDRALRIQRFTPRAAEIFSVRTTDVGRPLHELSHRLSDVDVDRDIEELLKTLQPLEREVATSDGRWFIMRISAYRTGEDRIAGAVLNFIDISERRRTQDQLRVHDERLRAVASSTEDYAIMTLDAHGRFTSWNRGAELMFGYVESEILGQHVACLYLPEDQARGEPENELLRARAEGRAFDERWHMRKNGSRFYSSGTTMPIADPAGEGFAKISRDLTERQVLEKQRDELLQAERQVREKLQAAHAMRSEFLAIMSHELKNPLNLILMNTELIGIAPEVRGSPQLERAVDIIRRTVRSQSMIIDDLLDLSRLNTGKMTLNRTALHARAIVERITQAIRHEAASKRISMSLELDDLVVYADSVRLEQIVWNLVSNAVKFTPAGGRITIGLQRDGSFARFEVSDTGQGMDATVLQHMFDMFVQGEKAVATRRGAGLGIGLALVKQLAQLHDGRVEARSAGPGEGSTLCVWLPLFEGQLGGRAEGSNAPFYGLHVLLVEDDVDTLQALSEVLNTQGAKVTAVDNAAEALRMAEAENYDLVVSDIGMPGMDGLQMIAALRSRERSAHWPAIAVTGFGQPADRDRAKAAGFDEHLTKPLSIEALHKAFARISRKPA